MLSHPKFLKQSEELQRKNPQALKEGMKIARGFADLGFEEFLLLPGQKLLALYSGKVTDFPEEHAHFFFPVFSADELVDKIIRGGFDIVSLEYREQRQWTAVFEDAATRERKVVAADTLESVFVTALSTVLSVTRVA